MIQRNRSSQQKRDIFAEIALEKQFDRTEGLIEPAPPELPNTILSVDRLNEKSVFPPPKKVSSVADLKRELSKQRRKHAKFLMDLAPEIANKRIVREIKEFDWRVRSEDSGSDFEALRGEGDWEKVKIPHYGPPLGKAVTYYRAEFALTEQQMSVGSLFICFGGVDYKAHVFINGEYLGSHEGFFAPFEFDFSRVARLGLNTLLIKVENDAICLSNDSWGEDGHLYEGDKLYAATGLGYDEPYVGWHHCPPGMGIYQSVRIEARPKIFISDIFVRPICEESLAEVWVEVYSCHKLRQNIGLRLSVFGQNFKKTVAKDQVYQLPGPAGPGVNYFRLPVKMPNPKLWDTENPWLYQAQIELLDELGDLLDNAKKQFGMRSFKIDEQTTPKGKIFLNGKEIRLRGANTMGFEQQDVLRKDWSQLIDDILLAKICNLNFLRITQRPVQPEVYDYCDRLGLMVQTDLPLFGILRRNQFFEAARQAGEMEKLVRSHPSVVIVSYINEPFPNAWGKPHRHLTRPELESFFESANQAVRLMNPDRVIKPVDGDYDPPAPGLPDNHCYTGWYNGHGLDIGKLHKGYWQKVKPGWMYACGEFGAEGLDFVHVMNKYYPKEWLPATPEEEANWSPSRIPQAQTGRLHYLWFETPATLEEWVQKSHQHQAFITKLMAEAFRRDRRMNSFAIHLFIDAFPSGWMKAIMDVDRNPKPAFFAYREALSPIAAFLRTDRFSCFSGEDFAMEAWVCNDTHQNLEGCTIHFQLDIGGVAALAKAFPVQAIGFGNFCLGKFVFRVPQTENRAQAIARVALFDSQGNLVHESEQVLQVFPAVSSFAELKICHEKTDSRLMSELAKEFNLKYVDSISNADVIAIEDFQYYKKHRTEINKAVERGAKAVLFGLSPGKYEVFDTLVQVEPCIMGSRHFVARAKNHPLAESFTEEDFKFWYNEIEDRISPFLHSVFKADGWQPILTSGNGGWSGEWEPVMAVAERSIGSGKAIICQISLAGFLKNPAARIFAEKLLREL